MKAQFYDLDETNSQIKKIKSNHGILLLSASILSLIYFNFAGIIGWVIATKLISDIKVGKRKKEGKTLVRISKVISIVSACIFLFSLLINLLPLILFIFIVASLFLIMITIIM